MGALVAGARTPGIQYLTLDAPRILFEYNGGWAVLGQRVSMDGATMMMAYSMNTTIAGRGPLPPAQLP